MKLRLAFVAASLAGLLLSQSRAAIADVLPPEPPGMTPEQRENWIREQNEARRRWYEEQKARGAAEKGRSCSRSTIDAGAGAAVVFLGVAGAMTLRRRRRATA